MKKLRLDESLELGGSPIFLNDLRFMQNGYIEALEALLKGIGNNNSVIALHGITYGGGGSGFYISDGYLFVNGEICKHDATDYPDLDLGFDGYYWDTEDVFDIEGLKSFASGGSPIDTYVTKKAIAVAYTGSLPSGKVACSYEVKLKEAVLELLLTISTIGSQLWPKLNAANEAWQAMSFNSPWANATGHTSKYRKTADGYLECWLFVKKTSAGTSTLCNFSDASYRPNKRHSSVFLAAGSVPIGIVMYPNGDLIHEVETLGIGTEYQGYFKIPLTI